MIDWTCKNCETIWAEGQRFCRFCDDPNAKIRELEAKLDRRGARLREARVLIGDLQDHICSGSWDSDRHIYLMAQVNQYLDAASEEKG